MLQYCLNEVQCRRSLIAKCFREQWKPEDCSNSCDICQRLNGCSNKELKAGNAVTGVSNGLIAVDEDISTHCKLLVEIIEQAQQKQQRLTALKVVEIWKKKPQSGLSVTKTKNKGTAAGLHGAATSTSDARREQVLLHAILEGVLKEEFHFTPYSTISYIGLGRKATGIKQGILRITVKHLAPQSVQIAPYEKKQIPSTSTLEQPKEEVRRCSESSRDINDGTAAQGQSTKKRLLPKMILGTPADDDDSFQLYAKRRRTSTKSKVKQQSDKNGAHQSQAKPQSASKLEKDSMTSGADSCGVVVIEID